MKWQFLSFSVLILQDTWFNSSPMTLTDDTSLKCNFDQDQFTSSLSNSWNSFLEVLQHLTLWSCSAMTYFYGFYLLDKPVYGTSF